MSNLIDGKQSHQSISRQEFFWLLKSTCTIHHRPFSNELAQQQFAAPHTINSFTLAIDEYGFDAEICRCKPNQLHKESFPLVIWLHANSTLSKSAAPSTPFFTPALILQADTTKVLLIEMNDAAPRTLLYADLAPLFCEQITRIIPKAETVDGSAHGQTTEPLCQFGFGWFLPELLKHKKLWQEILLASLFIQLIALATPLFTQTIIDKVVVHRSESTLIVIALGMLVFMLFSAVLSWLRQYLVLHTGNRVDAVLGSSVFTHLFQLPPLYFQHRPTGVIATRLQGVETIREFIASAAVTLILDLPFLIIFVAIMFYYSVTLSLVTLAILTIIVVMSAAVAPLFQNRLQVQFQHSARNQAFLIEYINGLETVKALQLEPQLNNRYSQYLAGYLQASFSTKQLANTYNTSANLLEQLLSLLILSIGAYTVMHSVEFTIGMLVAFQMFASRLSQPMLRLVGLWQQFQQASLSIARLGDLMNAPVEPYSLIPVREHKKTGQIRLLDVAFQYAPELPPLYHRLSLDVKSGQTIAIMGQSGCGKSTLTKLLQGFYQPTHGHIFVDGIDVRYLSANELRNYFGVVPQETTLFSGTIYDNLHMACPNANFEQIIAACKMAEIHGVIEALPQGYQTEIGERGAGLSGGQKQRIAIARALLKRPQILIFDEATSALDEATSIHFSRTVNSLKGKVTMLFITHALPKGLSVDALYQLNQQGLQRIEPQATSLSKTSTVTA